MLPAISRRGLLGTAAALAVAPRPAVTQEPRPDIIVIVMDDMRSSDWRALPQTQELVGGVMFDQFTYSTPLCAPSRATLLTGRYAHNHGVRTNYPPIGGWDRFHDDERRTLATALRSAGYRTALFGKYVNGWEGPKPPPGWDYWRGSRNGGHYLPPDRNRPYLPDREGRDVADFVASASADKPFFLWYAPVAPHLTSDGKPPIPAKRHRAAFPDADGLDRARLQSLLAVDDAVAGIAEAMGEERWRQAAIFVLSDNGWEMGEHGTVGKATHYDGSVRVPMLARCPNVAGGGRLAATIDLAPTIARAAGTTLPNPDGQALQDEWDRDAVLIQGWGTQVRPELGFIGVRTKSTTYIERRNGTRERYDRRDDPGEQKNLIFGAEEVPEQAYLEALRSCSGKVCRPAVA